MLRTRGRPETTRRVAQSGARRACWIGCGLFIGTTLISAAALAQDAEPGATPAPGAEPAQGTGPAEEAPPPAGAATPNPDRIPAWSFQPSIELDETFTDNADSTSTARKADAITTATPRFYATGEAPQLKGVFDYSPQIIDHAVDTTQNHISQNLLGSGTLTAVPDELFLDAHASMFDVSRTGDRGFGNATQIPTSQDTHTYAFSASPYARFRLADKGQAEVRYTYGLTMFSGNTGSISVPGLTLPPVSNATDQQGLVKFTTDPQVSRLQLEFDGSYDDSAEGASSSRHALGDVTGSYPITRAVYALASVGYERLTYQFQPQLDFTGPTWSLGSKYQPNPDQTVQLTYGEHEGQYGFTGQANYRLTAATTVYATYSEENSTAQQQILQNLDSATETTPGNVVDQSSGLPLSIANPDLALQNSITRTKSLRAGATLASGALDSYTLSIDRTEEAALTAGSIGQTSTGALLNWAHEINPDSNFTVSGGASTHSAAIPGGTSQNGTTLNAGASYNYAISRTLIASVRYNFSHTTGDGTGAILVNLLTFSIRQSF